MKFVLVIFLVVVLTRIDFILDLWQKKTSQFFTDQTIVGPEDIKSNRQLIPFSQDSNLTFSPWLTLKSLFESFHSNPSADLRSKIIELVKKIPSLSKQEFSTEFESSLFRLRDLMNNNHPELPLLLNSLQPILTGAPKESLRKFYALWMDIDMENFLRAYAQSPDKDCGLAIVFGDPVPEEEWYNEYLEREDTLKKILVKEGLSQEVKSLTEKCLIVLSTQTQKMIPQLTPAPEGENQDTEEESGVQFMNSPDGMSP
jgi:hypothetical protein